jgi:hypothetical protein
MKRAHGNTNFLAAVAVAAAVAVGVTACSAKKTGDDLSAEGPFRWERMIQP